VGKAKEIEVKVVPPRIGNAFIEKVHYSGKVVNNSSLHFGCFLNGILHGVISFGCPIDKRRVLHLVHTAAGVSCLWNEMLELNRMAFDDALPKNSESRCLGVAFRLIRKNAPHIKWVLSFADGTQCGDGAIYRASGFALTGIKKNTDLVRMPDGAIIHEITFMDGTNGGGAQKRKYGYKEGEGHSRFVRRIGAEKLPGFQLRYIYLLDKSCSIAVPVLPFSEIDRQNARMYKGEKRATSIENDAAVNQTAEGGVIPTVALQT
jgi:hypothetical protein